MARETLINPDLDKPPGTLDDPDDDPDDDEDDDYAPFLKGGAGIGLSDSDEDDFEDDDEDD